MTVLAERAAIKQNLLFWHQQVKLRPNDPVAHNTLGSLFILDGDYASALNECVQAIALLPTYGEAWFNYARALQSTSVSSYPEIYGACVSACRFVPNYTPAKALAAFIAPAINRNKYVDLWPKPPRVMWSRLFKKPVPRKKWAVLNRGEEGSESALRQDLAVVPTDTKLLCELGVLLHKQGRLIEAAHILEYAVAFDTDSVLLQNALANLKETNLQDTA